MILRNFIFAINATGALYAIDRFDFPVIVDALCKILIAAATAYNLIQQGRKVK